jgi:multiple sugar transport system permease protein
VPTKIVLSLLLALLLNRAGRSAGFFRTAFYLPKMTPPVAIGVLFLLLFNGQSGLINEVLAGSASTARPGRPTRPGSSPAWC